MKLPWELFLSLRYLKPKRTFVSVITLISVLGVTLGVMVLIVVMAVMSGFDRDWRERILGFNAHVTVSSGGIIQDPQPVIEQLENEPHVTAVAPFALGRVLIEFNERIATPYLKGIDPKREVRVTRLGTNLVDGTLDLQRDNVLVGKELARQYGIFVGDRITVFSPKNLARRRDEINLPAELTVTGIFEVGMYEFDYDFILTSLETAQELYELGHGVHAIALMTEDPLRADEVKRALNAKLPPPFHALTWMDLNEELFRALVVEKIVMFFILFFIIVVAAFGLANTQITVVVQKTKEIGILKALGATNRQIMLLFVSQGIVIGIFGTLLGLGLGMLVLAYRNQFMQKLSQVIGWDLLPRQLYQLYELPAQINPTDIIVICAASFLICAFASVFPAYRAARLEPVEAMRYE